MSLFLLNICKFNNCNLHFATSWDLVQHIEETHISADPDFLKKQEQQISSGGACIPLSYIYRVFPKLPEQKARPIRPEPTICCFVKKKKPAPPPSQTTNNPASAHHHHHGGTAPSVYAQQQSAYSFNQNTIQQPTVGASSRQPPPPSNIKWLNADGSSAVDPNSYAGGDYRRSTPPPEAFDETSNDGSYVSGGSEERRYKCPVDGCNKRYKNLNGVRYHAKNAHPNRQLTPQQLQPTPKPHKCTLCNKAYKTAGGLQQHLLLHRDNRTSFHHHQITGNMMAEQPPPQPTHAGTLTTGIRQMSPAPVVSNTGGLQPSMISVASAGGMPVSAAATQNMRISGSQVSAAPSSHQYQQANAVNVSSSRYTSTGGQQGAPISFTVPINDARAPSANSGVVPKRFAGGSGVGMANKYSSVSGPMRASQQPQSKIYMAANARPEVTITHHVNEVVVSNTGNTQR